MIDAQTKQDLSAVLTMLRDADNRLHRAEPDVFGAKVSLHGALLSVRQMLGIPFNTTASEAA